MNKDKALQHMMAWAIQSIYQTQKEAQEIIDNKDLSEQDKLIQLRGPQGPDYRLLNLILLLQPALEVAKEEYPEQTPFFEWFNERWQFIKEANYLKGPCGCKGCKESA